MLSPQGQHGLEANIFGLGIGIVSSGLVLVLTKVVPVASLSVMRHLCPQPHGIWPRPHNFLFGLGLIASGLGIDLGLTLPRPR